MIKRKKVRLISLRTYAIPIGAVIIFTIAGIHFTDMVSRFLVDHMEWESDRLANNYMSRLSDSVAATNVIQDLLNEKLIVANKTLWKHRSEINNVFLKELSKDLKIDEIYLYNSKGEIIYSTNDNYVGWTAKEGHPVYNFMKGMEDYLVEDIRKDTESDNYYKYAYSKHSNGEFIQIGILSDKVYELTNRFSVQQFIDTLVGENNITYIHFVDNDFNITASSDKAKIGDTAFNELVESENIRHNRNYLKSYRHISTYRTFSSIYVDGIKAGTLVITYSLKNTVTLIKNITIIIILILFFLLVIYEIMTFLIIHKNYKIERLGYYDSLTKLPNKEHFIEFFKEDIFVHKENNKALLLINCSNLKLVKLIFGYQGLDNMLIEITKTLKTLDINNTHLFRYSEDSFIVYIENYKDKDYLIEICNRILHSFEFSMVTTYGGKTITVKIGIVEIDESYSRIDDIIKDAEIALNNISEKENKKYCFFDETMREDLILNETIEKELRKVIYDNNSEEFYLEYQPQINLKTDYIVGFEALARWKNKELGIISPIKFIDVAEKQQLIVPLGRLILIKACNFIKTLENEGHKGIKVAVNISLIQLLQYDFITDVIEIIEKARIRPENLELEITETVLADNYEIINEKLSKLRKEGISISLDDFGTGHSSLARLKKINIDTIKIDKLFIDNLLNKDQEKVLTSSIISLVHKIGLMVIAEGVETEAQKQYLIKNNCDIMQGYLFSKPVSMENAIKLLSKTNGIELISEITI